MKNASAGSTSGRPRSLFLVLLGFVVGVVVLYTFIRSTSVGFTRPLNPLPLPTETGEKPFEENVPLTNATASGFNRTADESQTVPNTVEQRFSERKRLLDLGCQKYRSEGVTPTKNYTGLYLSIKDKVFYCPIEKTGSTEWQALFREMSAHKVNVQRFGSMSTRYVPLEKLEQGRNAEIRFLFVREPYLRFVSAYVDKLFSPNVPFWSSLGRYIVRKYRFSPSNLSLSCGHDVTFAEFIDYVIGGEQTGTTDGHFSPQFKHCHMSRFPYTHVGHLETIAEDRPFLLEAMDSPVDYTKDYQLQNLENQVSWYINDRTKYSHCLTVDEALRRLWQKLKMRGHIRKDLKYPMTSQQSDNITVNAFVKLASSAIELSRKGVPNLKDNKQRALIEAFASVSMEKKLEIKRLYRWDFELFGYDPHPEEVFGNNHQKRRRSLFYLWD